MDERAVEHLHRYAAQANGEVGDEPRCTYVRSTSPMAARMWPGLAAVAQYSCPARPGAASASSPGAA